MGREQYCPNMFYDTNQVSIGEFNTLQECMDFPIRDIWCINREEDNLFEKYKSQGNRVLIICCWERSDKWRFVVAIVKDGNAKYFDLNDLPMDLVQSDFETYIGKDAVATIKGLNECTIYNKETNENKIMNKKQVIRLNENQLRQIVTESVKRVLNEIDYSTMPTGDFYERDAWWKQQLDNDFPNHGIQNSLDWKSEYDRLDAPNREKKKKERQKNLAADRRAKEKERKENVMKQSKEYEEKECNELLERGNELLNSVFHTHGNLTNLVNSGGIYKHFEKKGKSKDDAYRNFAEDIFRIQDLITEINGFLSVSSLKNTELRKLNSSLRYWLQFKRFIPSNILSEYQPLY